MSYRLVLDEHVEHEVRDRLIGRHDVVHVDFVPELGKGTSDLTLAAYSVRTDRTILTYDDDFIGTIPQSAYRAVLYFEDDTLPPSDIEAIVDAMAAVYPHEEVRGLQNVGREWL